MNKWLLGLLVLILAVQIYVGIIINYPPTPEQLTLSASLIPVWGTRILTLVTLLVGLRWWVTKTNKIWGKNIGWLSGILLVVSPLFFGWWYLYPVEAIKVCLLFVGWKFMAYSFKLKAIVLIVLVAGLSLVSTEERSSIFHKLSFADAKKEANIRFDREDKLNDGVYMPLMVRRLSNNKVYVWYKEIVGEIIPFFDLETLFFQEVTPTEQKSIVIFYWVEVFLFGFGIYVLTKEKWQKQRLVLFLMLLAFINYLLLAKPIYLKLELTLIPISLIMGLGLTRLIELKKQYWAAGMFLGMMIVFIGYGVITNYFDLALRPSYLLDNRPQVYDFVYKNISQMEEYMGYHIKVTSLVGNSTGYCQYYLHGCSSSLLKMNGFDLTKERVESKTIYAGFAGEFFGAKVNNEVPPDWQDQLSRMGLVLIESLNIRDSVAYRYGNKIIIAVSK